MKLIYEVEITIYGTISSEYPGYKKRFMLSIKSKPSVIKRRCRRLALREKIRVGATHVTYRIPGSYGVGETTLLGEWKNSWAPTNVY